MNFMSSEKDLVAAQTVAHPDSSQPDVVKIADADLLFGGTFHRAGSDLHLSGADGEHVIVPGYFASEHPLTLVAPNGGRLTSDVVALLAGPAAPARFAEVQPTATASDANHHAGPDAIGHVQNVTGDVTVMRNGVVVALHLGDAVYKSDIIQTGGASSVGISFADGTAVNLVANTRMALSEYSYHANSDANSALFSLIEGTFAFVIGKAADAGNMKIVTPVATMSVHDGSTGWAHKLTASEIAAISTKLGHVTYSFAVVHKHAGQSDDIYDLVAGGKVIGSIADPHMVSYLDQDGNLISLPLDSPGEFADLLQWLQNNDARPGAVGVHGSGSSIDASSFPLAVNLNQSGRSFDFNPNGGGSPFDFSSHNDTNSPKPASNIFIWNGLGNWDRELFNWNQGFAPDSSIDIVFIQTGKSTFSSTSTLANLTVNFGATLNITAGVLTTSGLTNAGLIALNSSGVDPVLMLSGAITLTGGGTIEMLGPTTGNFIYGLGGAVLTNVDNLIAGSGNIGIDDGHLTFINKATVDATPINAADSGLLVVHTGNAVTNSGLFEATLGGKLLIEDRLSNSGRVEAIGAGSSVVIDNKTSVNTGLVEAIGGGTVTIKDSTIVNSGADTGGKTVDGLIEAAAGSEILLENGTILQGLFSIDAGGKLETVSGTVNRIDTSNGTRNTTTPSLVNNGTVVVNDDSSLTLVSPFDIENAGTIELASTGDKTLLLFNQPFAILSGGGNVILDGDKGSKEGDEEVKGAQDIIGGVAGPGFKTTNLENRDNTISGAGAIGQGDDALAFKNDEQGTVDANLNGQTLLIDLGANTTVNEGLFEATHGGKLEIASDLDNSGKVIARSGSEVLIEADVANESGGKIVARNKGATVDFRGVAGDRITVDNAGDISAERGGTVSFEHADITNEGADKLDPTGRIVADGKGSKVDIRHSSLDNDGVIAAKHGGKVEFRHDRVENEIDGLIVAKGDHSKISFDRSHVDNSGEIKAERHGQVRFEHSKIVNELDGSINAVGKGSRVTFEHDRVDNFGEMSATWGGSLRLDESWVSNERSGTIEADGRGSKVRFDRDHVKNSGGIEAENHGEVTFTQSHVDNQRDGTIEADGRGSEVEFDRGHVDNSGRIEAEHGGEVKFTKSHIDNVSRGTIEADGRGSEVEFDRSHVDNSGRIEAERGGEVKFTKSHIDNISRGTIEADGRGSRVEFKRDRVDNSGEITAASGGFVLFDESRISNERSGAIEADGRGSEVKFEHDHVDNSGHITAGHHGEVTFSRSDVDNERHGKIEADGRGSEVRFDRSHVDNSGRIEAEHDGEVTFTKSHVDNDSRGTIEADGRGSRVEFKRDRVDNSGDIAAASGGYVLFDESRIRNERWGTIEADGGGSLVKFDRDHVENAGRIEAAHSGEVKFTKSHVDNERGGAIEADGRGSEVKFDRSHVGNSGRIEAERGGEVTFDKSDVDNGSHGTIEADGRGSEVRFDRDHVDNAGRIEAEHGGEVTFIKSHVDNHHDGEIEARGRGSELKFERDRVNNRGEISATWGGFALFEQSWIKDAHGGTIEADGSGSAVKFDRDHVENSGHIEAEHGGEVKFTKSHIDNNDDGTIEAAGKDSQVRFDRDRVDNDGTIQARLNGAVYFDHTDVHNNGGVIWATGIGSTVDFDDGDVTGGQLTSASGGLIVAVGGISTLKDLTITSGSEVDVDATLKLTGTIHNFGTISVNLSGLLELVWSTLDGGLVSNHHVVQVNGTDTMEGGLTVAGGELVMETGATLHIEDTVQFDGVHVDNSVGAIIVDLADPATLVLEDGTAIDGGSLTVNGVGTLDIEYGVHINGPHGAALDGVAVSNSGAIDIGATATGAVLTLEDGTSVSGSGTFAIESGSTLDIEQGTGTGAHGAKLDGVAVTDAGAFDVGDVAGAVLKLEDGTIIGGGGTLTVNSGSMIDVEKGDGSGPDFGAVFSGLSVVDQGTIDVGDTETGTTLVVGGGTSIDGGGTGKLKVNAGSKVDTETTATLNGVVVTDNGDFDVGDDVTTTLTLGGGTVIGGIGTLTIKSGSRIDVEQGTGPGGTGARLDGLAVTDKGAIEIGASGTPAILTLDDGTAISGIGSIEIKSGSTLDVEQGTGSGAHGATLDGIAVTTGTSADSIAVGQTSAATLALKGGTAITGGKLTIGAAGGVGTVDVESAAGATLDGVAITAYSVTDAIEIAQTGTATLLLDDGTSIKGGSLVIGASGHTGTVDVETADGATFDGVKVTAFATADVIEVGQTSASALLLENGTAMTGGSLAVGATGHTGTVDVETADGATLDGVTVSAYDATDTIKVGQATTSTLLLKGGTSITRGSLVLGAAGGTVDVESDAGATLDDVAVTANSIAESIEVGQAGPSTLLLKNGTSVSGTTIVIGAAGNAATVDVESAAGATLDDVTVRNFAAADGVEVGQTGPSTLLLKDGTRILSGSLVIGASGHTGTVDVETASGATFDGVTVTAFATADTIEVGQNSASTLLLKDGTSMAGGTLVLGAAGGSGKVDVESAAGATLDGVTVGASNALSIVEVGQTGASTLLLKDGTSITNATLLIGAVGSTGTVDVESAVGATFDAVTVAVESAAGATFDAVTVAAAGALNTIDVGQTGNATLLLKDGTSMTGGTLALGSAAGTGAVDFEGTSLETLDGVAVTSYLTKGILEVGQTSAATLLMNDGTSITGGSLAIGAAGHIGTVDVESASGATFDGVAVTAYDATDIIEVGQTGTSKLLLKNGTSLSNGTLALGVGGAGTVNVESVTGATLHGVTVTAHDAADGIEIGKAGTSTLTMDGGTSMTGGTLTIDTTGTLQVDPSLVILSGVNLVNHGNVIVDPGTTTLLLKSGTTVTGGTIHVGDDGTLEVDNSTLTNVSISNAGIVDIGAGDTFSGTDTLTFVGAAELDIEAGAQFNLTLAGIDTDDTIDLKGVTVTSSIWDGNKLFINGSQLGFTVSGGLPSGDTFAFKTDGHGGTDLKVATQLVHVSSGTPGAGAEGAPIAIGFNTNIDASTSLTSYLISGIPPGAILRDSLGHSFTADATHSQVDIHSWNLASLTITPANDTNFQLAAIVTATDAQGYSYSATGTESVTVNPLPPVVSFASASVAGATGQPTAIGLSVAPGGEGGPNGDGSHNSISSVVISSIPNGATLTDGSGGHHVTVTGGSLDVTGWNYSGLTFTPTTNGAFSLTATVTEHDSDGQTSSSTAIEHITAITPPTISSNDTLGSNVLRPTDTISAFESGNPTNVTYQWFSSVDGYSHAIGSGQNYAIQLSDIGNLIEAVATFTAPDGTTASAASAPLGVVISPVVFNIGSQADLVNAINNISVGGIYSYISFAEFNFTANITLTSNLAAINLGSNTSLIINGNNTNLDGAGQFRGLFVFSGNVAIDNLNINHTLARGGTGGFPGGGGGAGLGGGLFVGTGAAVTIDNVNFSGDAAVGGNGGSAFRGGARLYSGGGGGGMGIAGGDSVFRTQIGKSYVVHNRSNTSYSFPNRSELAQIFGGGNGGTLGLNVSGHGSYANGAIGSRPNITTVGSTNAVGSRGYGNQGNVVVHYRGYFVQYVNSDSGNFYIFRPPAGFGSVTQAQTGSFGGGGGGGTYETFADSRSFSPGGNGGFGGGGGAGAAQWGSSVNAGGVGGNGGFGGGGGRGTAGYGGHGGFGAGNGASGGAYSGGGGGLGAGGGIFVEQGGSLTLAGGSLSGNGVAGGGSGGGSAQGGQGFGSGIFINGNQTLKFAPLVGETLTVANTIADQSGSGGTGANAGTGNVEIAGLGHVHFAAANTYTGTTTVDAGAIFDIDAAGSVSSGSVVNNGTVNLNYGFSSFGNTLTNNGTLNLNGGATMVGVLTDNGTMNVNAGTQFNTTVHDNGSLNVKFASVFAAGVDGNGGIELDNNGTTTFTSVSGSGTFTFGSGYNSTAQINSGLLTGTIKGFTYGDIIDLRGIAAATATLGANNILTLKSANGTTLGTLNFDPTQTGMHVGIQSDGHGGTQLSAIQTAFSVGSAADLNAALAVISQGGADYSIGATYTITFTSNISLASLSGQLSTINLGSGSTLLINGAGFDLDGANTYTGFLDNSAGVAIKDLSIAGTQFYGLGILGNNSITLSASAGQSSTIGEIADNGNGGSIVIGGGTVTFTSANFYTGGTTVASGATLNLAGGSIKTVVDNGNITLGSKVVGIGGAVTGTGAITFTQPNTVLTVASGVPTTTFFGLADGDVIDLAGIAAAGIASLGGNNYKLTSSTGATLGTLHFDPSLDLSSDALVLVADGLGGAAVRMHNIPVFTVSNAAQLAAIINQIHVGGIYSQTNTNYEIDLTASFSLTGNLPEIRLASGDSLSIVGHGFTISGASNGSAAFTAFIQQAGSLSISDLIISQTGGNGSALNMGANVSASLSNVTFIGNQANGGLGGAIAVAAGSTLTFSDGSLSGNTAAAGAAFWLNGGTVDFTQSAGHTITVANSIGGPGGTINISGDGDVAIGGFDSGTETINITGNGNVTLTGAFFGSQTINHTGLGTLSVHPVYTVASQADLFAVLNAIATDPIGQLGGVNYQINVTADVAAIIGPLNVTLAAGDTLTIDTNGHLLEGASNAHLAYATDSGGSTVLTGGGPVTFAVASASDLYGATAAVNGGLFANASYVVNLTADVQLTVNEPAFALKSGSTLTIDTHGHLLDGATNATDADFTFTTDQGGHTVLAANTQPTFAVASATDLASAFQAISTGGFFASTNTNYVINLTGDIGLTNNLSRLTLGAGDTLTIHTNGHLLDGATTPDLVFTPTGPNGSTVLVGNSQPTTFEISTVADLTAAIQAIGLGVLLASTDTNYVMNLHGDIALTANLSSIALGTGDTLTIATNGHLFDGATNGTNGNFTYTASGPGGSTVLTADVQPSFSVSSVADLAHVIQAINSGGILSSPNTHYEIDIGADLTLAANLPPIALAAGDTLSIVGNGFSLSGAGSFGGLNLVSGNVTLSGLALDNISGSDLSLNGGNLTLDVPAGQTVTENLSITGNGTIDFVGAGNLTLTGAFFGSQTVHDTGSGTLTIEPIYSVATASDLANAINAVNNNAIGQLGGVNYTVNLTADVDSWVPGISLAAGDTLTINPNGHILHGVLVSSLVFSPPAGGGPAILSGSSPVTFLVGSGADLKFVLASISVGGALYGTNVNYEIDLTADANITGDLPTILLGSGDTLTINGETHAINGGGQSRGLFLQSGNLSLANVTVEGFFERGGKGGDSIYGGAGGGGLGAGGGLFIGSGASATLNHVNFTNDSAFGGAGGTALGGGGFVHNGAGGSLDGRYSGGFGLGGYGVKGTTRPAHPGGSGGFGAGGGGGAAAYNSPGPGGPAGYGGGTGGVSPPFFLTSSNGGGGAGLGGGIFVATGGSLTIGGGSLYGNSVTGGAGGAGPGGGGDPPAGSGQGIGSGLFTASQTVHLAPALGETLTISDSIGGGGIGLLDVVGPGNVVFLGAITGTTIELSGTGQVTFPADLSTDTLEIGGSVHYAVSNFSQLGALAVTDNGYLTISGTDSYSGGIMLNGSGTVELASASAAGTGQIGFAIGATATLLIDVGLNPSNQINYFLPGDTIELAGFNAATTHATLGAGNILNVTDGTNSVALHLTPGFNYSGYQFNANPYAGGAAITDSNTPAITGVTGQPVNGSGVQLQGTAAPGDTVQIFAAGIQSAVGTAVADANGNFTVATSALPDGIYSLTAVQTGGATSAAFVVDVLPTAPALAPVTGTIVNGSSFTVSGTAEANATVSFYLDGSTTAFATAATGNGTTFSINTPALADGVHTVTATETDGQGLVSAASNIVVNVHPAAPSISLLIGQPAAGGAVRIQGTGEPNHTIVLFADNGTTVIGTGTTNASGKFDITTTATFAEGAHTLTAEAYNAAGNLYSSASDPFTVDVIPQAPSTISVVGAPINGSNPEIKGMAIANGTITLYEGSSVVGTGLVDGNGQFDFLTSAPVTDGVHHLTATVTAPDGFTSQATAFTLNVAPSAPTLSAALSSSAAPQLVEVQGTAEANEIIQVFADGTLLGQGTTDQNGAFDFSLAIKGGSHAISLRQKDGDGLTSSSSASIQVSVATAAPTITSVVSSVGAQIDASHGIVVKGTGQHVGETITIYADGGTTAIGSGTVAGDGSFTILTAPLGDGQHTLTATDTANSAVSAPSTGFDMYVDPAPVTNLGQVGVAPNHGTIELTGSGQVGDTVTLMLGNTVIGTDVVDGSGHFDVTSNPAQSSLINAGQQTVTVTQTDGNGHTGPAASFVAQVASSAPVISSAVSVPDVVGRAEVKGTGDVGAVIKLYADNGSVVIGTGTVDSTGHYDIYTQQISGGSHNITATESIQGVEGPASATANVDVVAVANTWTITSADDLAKAIAAIDVSGSNAQAGAHYTFNVVGDLTLTDQLPAFNLPQGASLTINGNHHTLDAHGNPGLFVYAGDVEIDDLSVVNAVSRGGSSIFYGGGGAGLGGGLFIASAGHVTLSDVNFGNDQAVGGNSSYSSYFMQQLGGGGGLNGGAGGFTGGGGIGVHANGAGNHYLNGAHTPAGTGIVLGAAAGGSRTGDINSPIYLGGANGGGGGQGTGFYTTSSGYWGIAGYGRPGSGGGIGGAAGTATVGGTGGFGGGGAGGGWIYPGPGSGGAGGFGGGGGAGGPSGGTGGFGGGGGGSSYGNAGNGGFGGANGNGSYGGGGLGAGGAIFVQQGGSLTFAGSGSEQSDGVTGGLGVVYGNNGSAYGSGIFLQGDQSITFAPDAGKSITLSGNIADMTGSHDHTGQTGTGTLVLDGAGTLVLSGNNTFTGGVTLDSGRLDVASAHGAGSGDVRFTSGAAATLEIDASKGAFGNAIDGFDATDMIVIDNFQVTGETYSNGLLTLTGATGSLSLTFKYPAGTLLGDFHFNVDAVNHTTTITVTDIATAWANGTGGNWGIVGSASTDWSPGLVPTAADDVTIAPGAAADFTVSIASGASAYAHNLTINDAHATLDDAGSLALSGGLTLTAGTLHLDGGSLQTVTAIDIANGATFEGYGNVFAASGNLAVSGTVTASDTSHALDFASAVTGTGDFHIAAGATLEFGGSVASGTTVTFDGGTGELKLDNPGGFNGTIVGFHGTAPDAADSDVIDLAGIDYNAGPGHFTQSYAGGVLTVSDGTHTAHLTFSNFSDTFVFATDGHGGTLVFDPPATSAAVPTAATELGNNFAFLPSLGAGTTSILDTGHDTAGLAQTVEQLNSLVTTDSHNNAAIDLGHDAAVPVMSPQQLQAVLGNAVHLH
ncbi:Ig-like domain-containing protein [Afipia sp. GAS231]|uniref:Ig-like domain-containing protein n=1 Tax=Afipia sp. GAS231 TaxID=1882747 RepID=UPI00087CF6F5|nr:Ig-like domain-containing protein [Afipia sp. GAS231]SDP50916.1 FecR family protein [Afipia sp. GAS231]